MIAGAQHITHPIMYHLLSISTKGGGRKEDEGMREEERTGERKGRRPEVGEGGEQKERRREGEKQKERSESKRVRGRSERMWYLKVCCIVVSLLV